MNINIYNPYVRDELMHHGILGQKWGKRNGPPYPLFTGAHSASEKKAGWRKSLNGESGTTAKKKVNTDRVNKSKRTIGKQRKDAENAEYNQALKRAKQKYENKLKDVYDKDEMLELVAMESVENQKELKYLSDAADKDKQTASDMDLWGKFQNMIKNNSIDWYNDKPKSEAAEKWKKERDSAIARVEKETKKAITEFEEAKKKDFLSWFTGDMFMSKKVKELKKKAEKERWDIERAVKEKYDDKLVDIVLDDLELPITDENRHYIINSGVLFWD